MRNLDNFIYAYMYLLRYDYQVKYPNEKMVVFT